MAWRIVIAGGGFGGFSAARTLERVLPRYSAQVTLVNDVNFMLYTPLLPGASAGTLEPRHVVVPLREELKQTDLRLGRVTGANPERGCLTLALPEGTSQELHYDQLIVALGSVSRTLPLPGLAEFAMGCKTLPEGIALRNRALSCLEMAEAIEDPAEREAYLTFVFIGAGYAGVEGLAELQSFLADVMDLYPRCRTQGMRFILVEARDRLMPEISEDLADFAVRELRGRGIEVRTETTVQRIEATGAQLSTGAWVPARTVVWTAGVKPHPSVERLGLELDERGRIPTDEYLRVRGRDNVWAVGDAAAVPDPARPGESCPPTAQHAIRQGRRAARNLAATLGSGEVKPFTYRTLGVFVDMGRHEAVASTMGMKWRGFPAWFLARTYHMSQMPGLKRKVRLVTDWTVDLLFSRDASELGQLGHPERLGDGDRGGLLREHSAGGTTADGSAHGSSPDGGEGRARAASEAAGAGAGRPGDGPQAG